MGWLRLVGSLKLQVSFAEYNLFHMALLQKRPMILRSLLIVATPYEIKDLFACKREVSKIHTQANIRCLIKDTYLAHRCRRKLCLAFFAPNKDR